MQKPCFLISITRSAVRVAFWSASNPSKEKEEFEQKKNQDLKTLGVQPDQVSAIYRQIYFVSIIFFLQDSHSSDHFATCEEVSALLRLILVNGSVDA